MNFRIIMKFFKSSMIWLLIRDINPLPYYINEVMLKTVDMESVILTFERLYVYKNIKISTNRNYIHGLSYLHVLSRTMSLSIVITHSPMVSLSDLYGYL